MSPTAKKGLCELAAMTDTNLCLLDHLDRLGLEGGQSRQTRMKAAAFGVFATVRGGYVSGGTHSPVSV